MTSYYAMDGLTFQRQELFKLHVSGRYSVMKILYTIKI